MLQSERCWFLPNHRRRSLFAGGLNACEGTRQQDKSSPGVCVYTRTQGTLPTAMSPRLLSGRGVGRRGASDTLREVIRPSARQPVSPAA